ncbi:AAA family ATPase [Lysobacter sp. HA18]
MTNHQEHPLCVEDGYAIYTKPVEHLANFLLANIAEGHHGATAEAGGGVGKSTALRFLTDNASRWLKDAHGNPMGVAARMIMPSGQRRGDRQFWGAMNSRLKLGNAIRLDAGVALERLVNYIRTRCGEARQRRMVLFIDNAQRITDAEYDYLEDLDALIAEEKLSLFILLMRQSDATGVKISDDWTSRPSHTVRRWFMDTTSFRPLIGVADVVHALGKYDRKMTFPTPDTSFTRYFARDAFDRGWTLSSQAALIIEVINSLRRKYKLPPTDAWPMATFTLTVRYLLADIAARTRDFRGFDDNQIRQALVASGYLRLEFVRAKLCLPDNIERAPAPEQRAA